METNKKIALIIICFAFLFGIFEVIHSKILRNNLIKHYAITTGIVTGFYKNGRGDADQIVYTSIIGGKKYTEYASFNVKKHQGEIFVGKIFPVIYDSQKITSHNILISPSDFKYYGINFPDSLNWVENYF